MNHPTSPEPSIEALVDALRDRTKILIICISHSWGGLEQVAANDASDFGKLGLKVRVLCLDKSPIHEYLKKFSWVEILPVDYRPHDYFDFKFRKELLEQVAQGFNIIHTHQTTLIGSITPWFWNKRDPVIFASRHILNSHDKRNLFHAWIYRRLDSLIVMSQTLKQNVLSTHPLEEEKIKVIRYGLDFQMFDPDRMNSKRQRETWGADEDTIVIGLVGRIDPAKGQATFIKAANGLARRKSDLKFKFVIVGEETLGQTSTYLAELKELVAQFKLEDLIVFAGYQENIPEIMGAFDLFVMPSRQETFGLVAIEAMAMGCPTVISRGGSAEEIVGKEEFGFLVRPDDAFDLQRQLSYLIDHPEERLRVSQSAKRRVKETYDRKVRLQKTLELYEQNLRKRGSH